MLIGIKCLESGKSLGINAMVLMNFSQILTFLFSLYSTERPNS